MDPDFNILGAWPTWSVSVDGNAVLADLNGDAALAFLIVKIGGPGSDHDEQTDYDEKRVSIHCSSFAGFLESAAS